MSPAVLLPLCPLAITYAIIKHRLWDIRTVAHRTALWLVLSAGLLVPIYVVVRLAAGVMPRLGAWETAFLLVLVFLLAHGYLRFAQPRLDHVFQRRVYDLRRVRDRFAEDMTRLGTPDAVAGRLLILFDDTLYPERVEVLYAGGEEGLWRRRARIGESYESSVRPEAELRGPLLEWLATHVRAVERSEIEVDPALEKVRDEARRYLEREGCEVVLPLVQGGDVLGVCHVGQKKSLRPYSQGDLELLEQIGVEASIGLANGLLFERVDSQRRALEEMAASLERRVVERTRDLEEAHAKLGKAYEDLQDLDRAKSRFFTNISHELRTPLTLILAPLEPMLDGQIGDFDEAQVHHLATIKRNALGLLKMIDNLLDLSRLEDSRLRLRLGPLRLAPFARRVVEAASSLAERKDLEVSFEARAEPTVEADEEKVETVLVNLLSNALKFTEPGGAVRVAVDAREGAAVLSVSDSGPGIPASDLERVFERFFQCDATATRRHGGAGVGLALARELVELHRGSIAVESELGRGATFTVTLPFEPAGLPEELVERRTERRTVTSRRRVEDAGLPEWAAELTSRDEYRFLELEAATERRLVPRERVGGLDEPRVLVVEDNPDMLRYLHQILAERYEVWPVQEGERAWELLLQGGHDVVVTDIMMPGLSGLDLCARIKGDPRTAGVPVVFLTARGEREHRIEGHGAGADAYLAKPFSPAELAAVIDRLLASRARTSAAAARGKSLAVETLLAGMAHELRNAAHQVQSAHAAICEAMRDAPVDERSAARFAALETVSRKASSRVTAVVEALRRYALGGGGERVDLDLDALARGGAELLSEVARQRGVALAVSAESGARVRGALEPLRQLVVNLVENAIHAVHGSGRQGTVTVETAAERGRARLTVRDDGPGMPREVLERAFEPFFTTKGPAEGSGLGLALARRTVSDMGGDIRIGSRPGAGTEVVVELPLAREVGAAAAAPAGGRA